MPQIPPKRTQDDISRDFESRGRDSSLSELVGRKDVRMALEAGFTPKEVAYMLDLPEDAVLEVAASAGSGSDER